MDKKSILLYVMVVVLLGALGFIGYLTFFTKTLEEKLEDMSFQVQDDNYIREVVQNEMTYQEILNVEENKFLRITENDTEKEVYTYDYENNYFIYLYYYSDELVSYLSYDYEKAIVIEDEDNLIELLMTDAYDLKEYFETLLDDNKIKVEDL